MSVIRSYNSQEANGSTPTNSLSVALTGVQQNDVLIIAISTAGESDATGNHNVTNVSDNAGNDWTPITESIVHNSSGLDLAFWQVANANASEALTVTAEIDGTPTVAFGLVLYDLSAGTVVTAGTVSTATAANPFVGPTLTDSAPGDGLWLAAVVSIGAYASTVASPWTVDEQILNSQDEFASVAAASGDTETPSFTLPAPYGTAPFLFPGIISVVVIDPPDSGGTGSSTAFLGSVRVLTQAPSNVKTVPFIGTVTKVASAPSGAPNPWLGSVIAATPTAGDSNPALGQVVEVTEVPSGETDVFLGGVEGT